MYAIIQDSGSQIKVSQGDIIKVALRELQGNTLAFNEVLYVGGDAPKIGQPTVAGAKVTAELICQERGDKIPVVKFRRRKNYKRVKAHRQTYLKVKITGISA